MSKEGNIIFPVSYEVPSASTYFSPSFRSLSFITSISFTSETSEAIFARPRSDGANLMQVEKLFGNGKCFRKNTDLLISMNTFKVDNTDESGEFRFRECGVSSNWDRQGGGGPYTLQTAEMIYACAYRCKGKLSSSGFHLVS